MLTRLAGINVLIPLGLHRERLLIHGNGHGGHLDGLHVLPGGAVTRVGQGVGVVCRHPNRKHDELLALQRLRLDQDRVDHVVAVQVDRADLANAVAHFLDHLLQERLLGQSGLCRLADHLLADLGQQGHIQVRLEVQGGGLGG